MFEAGPSYDPELLAEINATETSVDHYSQEALADSTVKTSIRDCQYPFLNLPSLPIWSADTMAAKPLYISSIDLSIDYNRNRHLFTPQVAKLNLDNGYSYILKRLDSLPSHPDEGSPPYLAVPLTPTGVPAIGSSEWTVLTASSATDLLRRVGVTVPQHEQPASWDAIHSILQFAGEWKAEANSSVLLDDWRRTVRVEEKIVGGTNDDYESGDLYQDSLRYREISVSVDEAPIVGELPTVAWQLINRSTSPIETPCIQALRRMPVLYEMVDANTMQDGDIWYGDRIRTELRDEATDFPISTVALRAVQNVLDEARLARA